MAACVSRGRWNAEPERPRLLRSAAGRTPGHRDHAVCDFVSLGLAAVSPGQVRWLAIGRDLEGIRELRRSRGGALGGSRQTFLYAERVREVREPRLWRRYRRTRSHLGRGGPESGPP